MKAILFIGRLLFSLIFLMAPMMHFTSRGVAYAASQGVPVPSFLVPFSGIIAFLGAVSIIIGFKARIGAWLIVLFLVPVSLFMHDFWNIADAMARGMQMAMFTKNMALLGGALIIAYFGSGPWSIDSKTHSNI
jgi:putative oxidoreductase